MDISDHLNKLLVLDIIMIIYRTEFVIPPSYKQDIIFRWNRREDKDELKSLNYYMLSKGLSINICYYCIMFNVSDFKVPKM